MTTLRLSQVRSFMTCPQKFVWSSVEGLEPKADIPTYYWEGKFGHQFLDLCYAGGVWLDPQVEFERYRKLFPHLEVKADTEDLMVSVLKGYVKRYSADLDRWEVLATETSYARAFPELDLEVVATLDLRVQSNKKHRVVDHKFLRRLPSDDKLELDGQVTGYLWMMREHGIAAHEFLYNAAKKKQPTWPDRVKGGGLTKRRNQDTTSEVYREAIAAYGLDEADYTEVLDNISKRGDKRFYRRYAVSRTASELDSYGNNLYKVLQSIARLRDGGYNDAFMHLGAACDHCPYTDLCKLRMTGGNVKDHKRLAFAQIDRLTELKYIVRL